MAGGSATATSAGAGNTLTATERGGYTGANRCCCRSWRRCKEAFSGQLSAISKGKTGDCLLAKDGAKFVNFTYLNVHTCRISASVSRRFCREGGGGGKCFPCSLPMLPTPIVKLHMRICT